MNFQTVDALSLAQAPQQGSQYEQLPMAIRQYYSHREYMYLTDAQKIDLLRSETEPDPE